MLLRDHPLMSYRGLPNWPPVWICKDDVLNKKQQRGEVGVLKTVTGCGTQPLNSCFLHIEHEGLSYIGCLLFDDLAFCGQLVKLLRGNLNRPIAEIGSIDLAHTL
jgi:hypothetical protein